MLAFIDARPLPPWPEPGLAVHVRSGKLRDMGLPVPASAVLTRCRFLGREGYSMKFELPDGPTFVLDADAVRVFREVYVAGGEPKPLEPADFHC